MADDEQLVIGPISGSAVELLQSLGWDTPRIWATGVQIFAGPEQVLFVLKEQTAIPIVDPQDPENPNRVFARNVGSFVLPLSVARAFQKVLNELDLGADGSED